MLDFLRNLRVLPACLIGAGSVGLIPTRVGDGPEVLGELAPQQGLNIQDLEAEKVKVDA